MFIRIKNKKSPNAAIGIKGAVARSHLNFSLKLIQAPPSNAGMRQHSSCAAREWSSHKHAKGTHSQTSLSLCGVYCATLSVIAFTFFDYITPHSLCQEYLKNCRASPDEVSSFRQECRCTSYRLPSCSCVCHNLVVLNFYGSVNKNMKNLPLLRGRGR